ncbi:MAG: ComEC family competence protein [Bacteroidota bacterium]|nr:ComEC family competence protein [Bacteroidota bacterium]
MDNFAARIPLLRLLIPFILGIIACYYFELHISCTISFALILFCVSLLSAYKKLLKQSLSWRGADGVLISLALFFSGLGICSIQSEKPQATFSANETNAVLITLFNDPVIKERSIKLFAEVSAEKNGEWNPVKKKMLIYLQRDPSAEKLRYGDKLILHSTPAEVQAPKNPEEFDYKAWLARQGVYEQAYGKSGSWKLISGGNGSFFKEQALELRRYFLNKLNSYGFSTSAYGVAAALLLGASDHLDPGTIQSYSASGTLHVLSVSGMHVALVYIVLLKLLAPLERRMKMKWLSIFIQLVFLWFYATLTGLCPSVLRSVTMLSVVIAGRAFNRNAHILNSLSASALILLLFNPLLLFDIGFQLSYLAVGGIVMLQPKLESLWEPDTNSFKGKILKHCWTLVSVTLVAQVFTFPLGLYYFQQFPLYFILSNLVIIPLSTIVMYAGLFLLIVSPFIIIAKPIAVLFGFLVELLNACVAKIEHLPSAVLHSAKWEKMELLLLYLCICFLILFLIRKRKIFLRFGMATLSVMLVFGACESHKNLSQRHLVFFNVNHASVIAVVNGKEMVLLTDTTLLKHNGDIDFHVEPFLKARGVKEEDFISISDSLILKNDFARYGKGRLYAFGKQVVLVDQHFRSQLNASDKIILMRNNAFVDLKKLIEQSKPDLVVANGSSGKKKIAKWKLICEEEGVKFYDVTDEGALVLEE